MLRKSRTIVFLGLISFTTSALAHPVSAQEYKIPTQSFPTYNEPQQTTKSQSQSKHQVFELPKPPPEVKPPLRDNKKVVIYIAFNCQPCQAALDYFQSQNIKHEVKNIYRSKQSFIEYLGHGQGPLPMIFVDDTKMKGFDAAGFESVYAR